MKSKAPLEEFTEPRDCLSPWYFHREFPHATKAALEVVEEYASKLKVSISRVRGSERDLPLEYLTMRVNVIDDLPFEGVSYFGFKSHSVVWCSPRVRHVLYGLIHEVTHARFPKPDPYDGPYEEWEIGLIPYELAWLDVLCPSMRHRPGFLRWEQIWRKYGNEGRPEHPTPMAWRKARALEVAKKFDLPVPGGSS